MRTQAELELVADVRGIRAAGRALKDVFTGGASEATKLKREINDTDRATANLAKTARKLNLELLGVKAGTAEYNKLAGQIDAAEKAMRSLRAEAARMRDLQRQSDTKNSAEERESEARRHRIASTARATAAALTGMAGSSPTAPYSAMAGAFSAAGNAATAIPFAGVPLSIAAGVASTGMQIRQQRMDRYLQWRQAWAGSAPHIDESERGWGFGAGFGMSPEQAMSTAAGFGSATGGAVQFGRSALEASVRGFGAGSASVGASLWNSGQSNAERLTTIRNVQNAAIGATKEDISRFGGTLNPQLVEKYLERIASYTQALKDNGVDVKPLAVAGMFAAFSRAGYAVRGQAGLTGSVFAGQRGAALGSALSGMVGGEGIGGVMGLLSTGFGQPGGPGLADALAATQNGVGPGQDQVSPAALTATIQHMFGRGGGKRDLIDVVMGRGLGLSHQQFSALRRVTPSAMEGGAPAGDLLRDFTARTAQPEVIGRMDRQAIASGAKYANAPDLATFMQTMFDVQTGMADFAGALVPIVTGMVKLARTFQKDLERLMSGSSGSSVPATSGR